MAASAQQEGGRVRTGWFAVLVVMSPFIAVVVAWLSSAVLVDAADCTRYVYPNEPSGIFAAWLIAVVLVPLAIAVGGRRLRIRKPSADVAAVLTVPFAGIGGLIGWATWATWNNCPGLFN